MERTTTDIRLKDKTIVIKKQIVKIISIATTTAC